MRLCVEENYKADKIENSFRR